ncbi:MAG: hypothetical protein IPJ79_18195 [Bacteroidetes bacterium]|nr:hypothetical protein [Bacteroidota bacterium]
MTAVTSQFSKKGNRLIFLAIIILSAFLITCYYFLISGYSGSLFAATGACLLVLAAFMLLIHRELYFKMISMQIDEREIELRRYSGYFFKHKFFWNEVDGYEIKTEESESYDISEVIKLKANGKTIAIVSEFYYENYNELKSTIIMLLKGKRK